MGIHIEPDRATRASMEPTRRGRPEGFSPRCNPCSSVAQVVWAQYFLTKVSVAQTVDREGKQALVVYQPGRERRDRRLMSTSDAKMVQELVKVRVNAAGDDPSSSQRLRAKPVLRTCFRLSPFPPAAFLARASSPQPCRGPPDAGSRTTIFLGALQSDRPHRPPGRFCSCGWLPRSHRGIIKRPRARTLESWARPFG